MDFRAGVSAVGPAVVTVEADVTGYHSEDNTIESQTRCGKPQV